MNDAHEKDKEMKKFKGVAKPLEFQYDEYILHIGFGFWRGILM